MMERSQIQLDQGELTQHVQESLDDTHRELAWIRGSLIAALYGVLGLVNYLTLADDMRLTATFFAWIVAIAFAGFACFHRYVTYPAAQTNAVTFIELLVLQADSIAFSFVTDDLMGGFGVYIMIVAAGIFMTDRRWFALSLVMLVVTWAGSLIVRDATILLSRESLMMISATFMGCFFFFLRMRSARRLGEHQLMELKYKESLEDALEHIDTLRGLLPICASCKSIRDDDGHWGSVEAYVAERSEVEFTHSLCPACRDRLYPEFAET